MPAGIKIRLTGLILLYKIQKNALSQARLVRLILVQTREYHNSSSHFWIGSIQVVRAMLQSGLPLIRNYKIL